MTTDVILPADVARCDGVRNDGEWREGCADCLRRTAPRPWPFVVGMKPPAIIVFECESYILPGKEAANAPR